MGSTVATRQVLVDYVSMASRRRRSRAQENPSTGAWLAIGLGAAALGVGAYFVAKSMSSSSSASPQLPPNTPAAPPGDKYIVVTIPGQSGQGVILLSQACAAARQLAANGNAADAAAWAQVCQSNGGTV